MTTLVAYDHYRAAELLRFWTPQQLREALNTTPPGAALRDSEKGELSLLLHEWEQRALGAVSLRDALLIDPKRGARVYDLLCTMFTVERCSLATNLALVLEPLHGKEAAPHHIRDTLVACSGGQHGGGTHGSDDILSPSLVAFLDKAEAEELTILYQADEITTHYPFPPKNLDELLPPPPAMFRPPPLPFVTPTGWRRNLAIILVLLGVVVFGVPLLLGSVPAQPAGWPLGLLTLGLVVGIRAGWAGWAGAVCIWLVANLPDFHYHAEKSLWLFLLFLAGILLLACDEHVQSLWHWAWQRRRA